MLDATLIRVRPVAALIVGATGRHVLRIVSAFEGRRIITIRAEDVAEACERMALEMPHVVLVLVPPRDASEREALAERAVAVGALVVHVDPRLDEETFQHLLDRTVQAALERKIRREEAEIQLRASGASDIPEALDDGWDG